MIALDHLGDAGQHVLNVFRLGAEARYMPPLIQVDLVAVLDDVLPRSFLACRRFDPFLQDGWRIPCIVDQVWLFQQPVEM